MLRGRPGAGDDNEEPALPAGPFSVWLAQAQAAIRGETAAEVPCAGCTACCTSFQFVQIAPDETETLARIPAALLSPAPRLPAGHVVLGYDERGHCPMLVDNECSIYEHRPRTCRAYDCRVFTATGVQLEGRQEAVARRARRWRFEYPTQADRTEQDGVRAAVAFVDRHREVLRDSLPLTPTALAAAAVAISGAFVERDAGGVPVRVVEPDPDRVRVESTARGAD
jgi:Fe-S-cluster containining protein